MNEDENNKLQEQDVEQNIMSYTLYRDTPLYGNKNINFTKSKTRKFAKNYQKNIPLLIKDIVNLKLDENNFGQNMYAYGIQFGAVMIYGISIPKGCDYKTNKLKYSLDDGTGEISIKYNLKSNKECKEKISLLKDQLDIEFGKNNSTNSKSNNSNIGQNLRNLLRKADENVNVPEVHYKPGSRLYVVGIPYKIHNETWIHAKQIDLDQDQSRNKEILYKEHLIRFYNKHTKNIRLDGSNIDIIC